MQLRIVFSFLVLSTFLLSCDSDTTSSGKKPFIKDLPFSKAKDAKEYADLVLKSIKSNRDKPLVFEMKNPDAINHYQLKRFVGMYSTALIGRDDWQEYDIYAQSKNKDQSIGFDYAWLEPKGRLGLQIYILPKQRETGEYFIDKLEFRSRIDVMECRGFPGGEISNYKKLDFNWE
jgi:hypothetical protein